MYLTAENVAARCVEVAGSGDQYRRGSGRPCLRKGNRYDGRGRCNQGRFEGRSRRPVWKSRRAHARRPLPAHSSLQTLLFSDSGSNFDGRATVHASRP